MKPVFMDLETRSFLDLRKVGGRTYAADPSTEITVGVWVAGTRVFVWLPFDIEPQDSWIPEQDLLEVDYTLSSGTSPPDWLEDLSNSRWIAHNAMGFDAHVWASKPYPQPDGWTDSLPYFRRYALPGMLDGIGEALYETGKHVGRRTMLALAIPHKKTGSFLPITKANAPPLVQYCILDTLILAKAWADEIEPRWREDGLENRVLRVDRQVNSLGVRVDEELATAIIESEVELRRRRGETIEELTGGGLTQATLRSVPKFRAWLYQNDVIVDDCRRDTLLEVAEDPETPPLVRQAIEARIGETRITSAKLERSLRARAPDGRVHDVIAYHAAGTGRWGGRKLQPHNLPRPAWGLDLAAAELAARTPDLEARVEALLSLIPRSGTVSDVLSSLIRLAIVPEPGNAFVIVDFASIEARGLAYLAGDDEGLETYRLDRDAYKVFASRLYGVPYEAVTKEQRTPAKVAVLGAGYQMSGAKLGAYAAGMGIDLGASGWTGPSLIDAWRDANPLIAGERTGETLDNGTPIRRGGLWKDLQAAVFRVIREGRREVVGRCEWYMIRKNLVCRLPSGRRMFYRNARIEDRIPVWGGDPKPAIVYDKVLGKKLVPTTTYGGKLVENITQAFCRDFLAEALLATADLRVPLHVHDEIVVECQDPEYILRTTLERVTEAPQWAADFPLKAEGFVSPSYRKDPESGWLQGSAYRGILTDVSGTVPNLGSFGPVQGVR